MKIEITTEKIKKTVEVEEQRINLNLSIEEATFIKTVIGRTGGGDLSYGLYNQLAKIHSLGTDINIQGELKHIVC